MKAQSIAIKKRVKILLFIPLCFFILLPKNSNALVFNLPPSYIDIVGEVQHVKTLAGDNFEKLARRYDVGFHELVESNPKYNPFNSLSKGHDIMIPTRFILPPGPRKGVVVNLAEMRLYHYMPEQGVVATYPVGVGRLNWATPLANTKIVRKKKDPAWHVPNSIKSAAKARGVDLPDVVPAGPENPLGGFAVYLGIRGYLIHGTLAPEGVGKRVSHGCMRMFPEDIAEFFYDAKVGSPVRIIHQHAHAGRIGDTLYLEVHKPLKEHKTSKRDLYREVTDIIYRTAGDDWKLVDWDVVNKTIQESRGVPVDITT